MRRYLPSDIKIKDMHRNYCESSGQNASFSFYYKAVKEMDTCISFAVFGHQECAQYHVFEERYEPFTIQPMHKRKRRMVREEHQKDSETKNGMDYAIFSAYLRMNQFKRNLFNKRLCVFNETFSKFGKINKKVKAFKDMAVV